MSNTAKSNQEKIALFCQKGVGYEDFLYLAVQPLVFSSDLLYQLWLNFRAYKSKNPLAQPSYLVVSDLILSTLCQPIGVDLFRIEETVRKSLLQKNTFSNSSGSS